MGVRTHRGGSINNLICVGDIHSGCQLALCPPKGVRLDNGGQYIPSRFQKKLWAWWTELWDEWVPEATDGEPYAVCNMGDAVDGVHHNSTTQISHNAEDQARIARAVLGPVVERCGGRYYHIRGTEAHVGASAEREEALAESLGAIENRTGQCARYELWKMVGPALIHAMHHIGSTGSQHYESTAVHKELIEAFTEAGRWNRRHPDVIVRAHRHRAIETVIPTARGEARAIVCPGWQGKTPFAFRIPGARQSEPQFGAWLIRWSEKRGELFVRSWVRSLEREDAE